jgi:hypothetical protein
VKERGAGRGVDQRVPRIGIPRLERTQVHAGTALT